MNVEEEMKNNCYHIKIMNRVCKNFDVVKSLVKVTTKNWTLHIWAAIYLSLCSLWFLSTEKEGRKQNEKYTQ